MLKPSCAARYDDLHGLGQVSSLLTMFDIVCGLAPIWGQVMSLVVSMDGYSQVCRVLDELTTPAVTPVGWRGPIYSAIDHLRASSAPAEQVELAERISVTLLQLDWAILKGDGAKQEIVREQLSTLGKKWRSTSGVETLDEVLELREAETINEALERLNQRQQSPLSAPSETPHATPLPRFLK